MGVVWEKPMQTASGSGGGADIGMGGGGGIGVGGRVPAYQAVERRGIFDFGEAHQIALAHFDEYRRTGADEEPIEFTRDLVYLSAAEWTLLLQVETLDVLSPTSVLPLRSPLVVSPRAMGAAIIKADCGGMDYHRPRANPAGLRLWDVALFGGDMSKIELVYGEQVLPEEVEAVVERLEEKYAASATSAGRMIGASGILRIEGLLWKAKLALNLVPDEVEAKIDEYLRRIPLVE